MTDQPMDPTLSTDAAPSAEEIAGLAAAAAVAMPLAGLHDTDAANAPTDPDATATDATSKPARRARVRGWVLRLAGLGMSLALFVGGLALGAAAYSRVQPAPPIIGEASTGGIPAPAVVKELADALASNNADSLRSAVSGDPWRLLNGELQSWDMQGVTSVETLATMQDGTRSATEIVITGRRSDGSMRVFNLVVHVDNNQIVNFR